MASKVFFTIVVLLTKHSWGQTTADRSALDPIAIYPLNGNCTTREIIDRQPAGNAYDVSLADGPDGITNGSYRFYGNNNSYIEFPNNGSLNAQQSITMLCWVYFAKQTATGPLLVYNIGNDKTKFFGMVIFGNALKARFKGNNLVSELVLSHGQWHHVGASYNHSTGKVVLWINGKKEKSKTFDPNIAFATEGYKVKMGSVLDIHFEGQITAMQIYKVALTQEQINKVKNVADQGCRLPSALTSAANLPARSTSLSPQLTTSTAKATTATKMTTGSSIASLIPSSTTSSSLSTKLRTSAVKVAVATTTTASPMASAVPLSAISSSLSTLLIASSSSSVTQTVRPTSPKELAKKFIDRLDKIDVRKRHSLQEAVGLFQKVTDQYDLMENQELQPDTETINERRESIFQTAVAFEKFALSFGRLTKSAPEINITNSKLSLRIQRLTRQNGKEFSLEGPGRQTFIKVPSINFDNNGSVVVAIMYKDLHKVFNSDKNENIRRLNTIIVAVTMDPKPKQLQQNVVLRFKSLQVKDGKRHCVFLNGFNQTNSDGWSEEGCHVVRSKSNSVQTECSCNHLTHFAVLFDYGDNPEITKTDEKILKILTYVGLALSIMGIVLTITPYIFLTDVHQPLSQIRVSLTGSLGAAQIIFLGGINATGNKGACVTVAVLIQYFLMAAFCWMLVEGIYLYLLVVQVYNINNKMFFYHSLSWGFPAIMVAVSLSIAAGKEGIQSFVSDDHCWMSSANNLIWIFVAFVVMIEVVNLLLLLRVIKEMSTMQSTGETNVQQIRLSIKACVVFVPLLGITWLFGLLSPLHKSFVYIFTILNSIQGFLIFLLHCMRNSQIRERFKRRFNAIFPAANERISAKKTSRVDQSDVGAPRIIEVQPPSSFSVIELK